jgi:hypothetical protein
VKYFTMASEQNKRDPSLFRVKTATTAGFQEIKSNRMIISSFLRYEPGAWQDQLFNIAVTR